jgi:hypothetical protein
VTAPWTDPTQTGEDILQWLLAREAKTADDPFAVTRGEQAITDAQLWIWRQRDWWWAIKSATFDAVPSGKVTLATVAGNTLVILSQARDFAADDWIEIDEGDKNEIYKVSAVTDTALTTTAQLENIHAIGTTVTKLPSFETTETETRLSGGEAKESDSIGVNDSDGFSVGDYVVIAPGTARENFKRIGVVDSSVLVTLTSGLDIAANSGDRFVKVTLGKRTYPLRTINNGVMRDFGKLISIRPDTYGPMTTLSRSEFERSFEDDFSGRLSEGERYLIEGDPSQIINVDYIGLPPRYRGSENIVIPVPFQDLLRYVARWYFRDDDDTRGPLEGDPFVVARLAEMAGWSPSAEEVGAVMRSTATRTDFDMILPLEPEDFLDKNGVAIN